MTPRPAPSSPPSRPSSTVAPHLALGAHGEDLAAEWYRSGGYRIVARNWRCREGEIDLIAARGGTVVIAEVKTRSSRSFGSPAEAVNHAKQRRLRTLAARWLASSDGPRHPVQVRFDVVSVVGTTVEVIPDAF